ncbi:MAG: outer membrane beta-barrel family protein [Bacteroidota bacterium]
MLILIAMMTSFSLHAGEVKLTIRGMVIDADSKAPVEFATVAMINNETDELITGTTTGLDGKFEIKTNVRNVRLEVSFIGYKKKAIEDLNIKGNLVDVGLIDLYADKELLEEVVVQGERSTTEFKLDKRVFNVGQDLSSSGASALEVLDNVPSVNVNIEGEISLRGSTGVQVLINGKPSVLTSDQGNSLGTITADMIQQVEVITNPSAKYDAEGTSGIINIVIKKEERKGTNGSISVNTGAPHNHSVGVSLNHRTEKFNLFSQLGVGYRSLPNDTRNVNEDRISGETLNSEGEEFRNENFYNFTLGTDYRINDESVITISGNFAYEIEDQPSETNFQRTDANGNILQEWVREEETSATNPKYQFDVQYKKDFKDNKDHDLIISALGSHFGKDLSSEFTETGLVNYPASSTQLTDTEFKETEFTYKLDYTRPFSENTSLETGAQYNTNLVTNDFAVANLEEGVFVNDPTFTNVFEYDQKVLAVYGTYAYESDQWGLKGGLRLENTDLTTILVTTGEENIQNFTNLFPSFFATYKISKTSSVQAGYSRRVARPRLWDLNPFFNIRNNFNIRTGNPDLQPEFTDSYEVTTMLDRRKASFNFSVYHRFTTDVVERVSIFENNVNITRPLNIGTNRSTGIEVNSKYDAKDWLVFNMDFNYSFFSRVGTLETNSFDFSSDEWSTRLNSKWKLPADIDLELTGQYRSRVITVQSEIRDNLFFNLGGRKKIMSGKGVISFSVRDLFAARVRQNVIHQEDFYLFSFRQRGRFVTLGFSYGFGKGEAMQFTGSRRR